jgi:N6-adenosine-specific RNA methylase IME4
MNAELERPDPLEEGADWVIPDPLAEEVPAGWGIGLLALLDRIGELPTLDRGRAELGGYVAAYRKKGLGVRELRAGERMVEVRMGELLGPAPGQGSRTDLSGQIGYDGLAQPRVAEFRALAEHREDVIAWVKGGTLGRAPLLARIAAMRAGYRTGTLDSTPRCAVIYADPPWRYEHNETPDGEGTGRAIENQYTTMTTAAISALDVPAADDAVLFLWATNPKLAEALEVMAAWGFTYRTNMVWVKDRIGMGYYVRGQHELLLVGKRGGLPVPDPANRPASVINAPVGEHSAKPEAFYGLIERMYAGLPKAELFARAERPGWHHWGHGVAQ